MTNRLVQLTRENAISKLDAEYHFADLGLLASCFVCQPTYPKIFLADVGTLAELSSSVFPFVAQHISPFSGQPQHVRDCVIPAASTSTLECSATFRGVAEL